MITTADITDNSNQTKETSSNDTQEIRVLDPDHHELIIVNPENPEEPIRFKISGSFTRSLISNSVLAYSARGIMSAYSPAISSMSQLNQTQKSLLVVTPLLSAMLMPIPITWMVHRWGGKYEVLLLSTISVGGLIALSTLSACTDISEISSIDWAYMIMMTSGFLIGTGAAALYLIIDTLKWCSKEKSVPPIKASYNFIIDTSSILTSLFIYALKPYGFFIPFISLTYLHLSCIFAAFIFFNPSPYNQFKQAFPKDRARVLAIEYGQLDKLISNHDKYSFLETVKENLHVLWDRRAIPLTFSLLTSLASSWFTRLILPSTLNTGFGFSKTEAIITSSLAYLIAIISRPLTDLVIKKWDISSGGVKIHILGCLLSIVGAITLANTRERWALYLALIAFNIGDGMNLVTPLNIAIAWSKPVNQSLEQFNPATMFGIFRTIGSLGSIILPLILGLLVDESGQDGYTNYFYMIVAMMSLSAITIPIIDVQVRKDNEQSIFSSKATFFSTVRNLLTSQQAHIEPPDLDSYLEKID